MSSTQIVFNNSKSFSENYIELLASIPISKFNRDIITGRYLQIVSDEKLQYSVNYVLYFLLTNIITISGILITAFVSFNKLSAINDNTTSALLWTVWALGIAVAVSNKLLSSFDIPKKYVLGAIILEKLHSEGWSFMAGINEYKDVEWNDRFLLFCSRIEKIKLKSVESTSEIGSNDVANSILAMGQSTIPPPPNDDYDNYELLNCKPARRSKKILSRTVYVGTSKKDNDDLGVNTVNNTNTALANNTATAHTYDTLQSVIIR